MYLHLLAQTAASKEWYEQQIAGVVAGALIAAMVATALALINLRHQRATRWDEARRGTYSNFIAVLTETNDTGHAEIVARYGWIRAPEETRSDMLERHIASVEACNAANRRRYDVHAEVRLLATDPVAQAAQAAVDETTARLKVVEASFEDIHATPPTEIGKANVAWERCKAAFIDAASQELGITRS